MMKAMTRILTRYDYTPSFVKVDVSKASRTSRRFPCKTQKTQWIMSMPPPRSLRLSDSCKSRSAASKAQNVDVEEISPAPTGANALHRQVKYGRSPFANQHFNKLS